MLVSNKNQFNLFNKNWQVEATVKRFVFTKSYYLPFSLFFVSLFFFEGVFVIWWWITPKNQNIFIWALYLYTKCPDNCLRGKLACRVWFRVRARIRFGRHFSTEAIVLEPNINILLLRTEAVARRHSVKKEFLKILQNWHDNTFVGVFFLITLHAWGFSVLFAKF